MVYFIKRNKILVLSFISLLFIHLRPSTSKQWYWLRWMSLMCIAIGSILTSLTTPAYAWKLKTHAYIANIVMDDAKDGKVWIPPYGEFEVRPEVAEAIKLCPEFFRGGSMGPDGFPDFWTGQAKIHPNTNPWLQLLWYSLPPYNAMPLPVPPGVHYGYLASDNPKRQAWAFTFGYFSHAAGDMWAHDWVNVYAGGYFPGVFEITADPTNKLPIVTKHIAIETTLDKRIPLSTSTIDIPNDYVINTMILNQQAIALGMNPIASYFATKYFEKLPHKNETTGGTSSGGISVGGYNINVGTGMTAPVLTYDALWFNDLESGFKSTSTQNPGWMEANKRAIKDVMELNSGMIGSLGSYLGMWSLTYFFDMLGFPSVTRYLGEGVAKNQARIDSALDAIGLDQAQRSQITDDIVNALLVLTMGMTKTTFDQVWTTEMTTQLFDAAKTAEILGDMGFPPSEATWKTAWTNQNAFNNLISTINGPLYNSVITTKIMMLKPTELKRLLGGKKLSGLTGEVAILGVLRGIDFSKQFAATDGLGGDWLGYGMNLSQLQDATWKPIFPVVFKPYGPRDNTRQEIWSSSLDASHRWAAIYPVTPQMLIKPTFAGGSLWNLKLNSATSNSLTVSWDKYPYVDSFGKYTLTINCPSANTTATFDVANINTTTYTFQNLASEKYYAIFIKAKSPSGQVLGEEWSLGTTTPLPTFAGGSLWNIKLNSSTSNSITISWDKYPYTAGFGKYVLTLNCPSANTTATFDVTNINTTTYTFQNLAPQKYYAIFLKAKSPSGQVLGQEWSLGTTTALPTFAGGSLWNIRLNSSTSNSITISWDKYPYADAFGKYILTLNCQSTNTTATFDVTNINTTTYTFQNLTPDQPYAIFLKAKSPGGQALGEEWSLGTRTARVLLPSVRLRVLASNQPASGVTVEVKKVNTVVSNVTTGSDGLTPLVEFEPTISYYFSVKNQECYADYASAEYHMPAGASGEQTNFYVINLYPKMPWGGKVYDSQGNPVSGVTVTTSGKTATTDASGAYNFGQWLPVSSVNISFSKPGYTTKQLQGTVEACGLTRKLIIPDCVLEAPDTQPPVLSNITMSQFNSETIEVVFQANEAISSASLEYKTPGNKTKTIPSVSGQALHGEHGAAYGLSVHEAGMPAGIYKVKIKAKDASGNEAQTGFSDFALFGTDADWKFKATPGAKNSYVLTWNKYPRQGEFKEYVLDKGDQLPSTTTGPTSYDAGQIRPQQQAAAQPIKITNINTTTKTVTAAKLNGLTLTARSKRGNFLTKPIAPTVVQAQTATSTSTTTTTSTSTQSQPSQTTIPPGVQARQRYQ